MAQLKKLKACKFKVIALEIYLIFRLKPVHPRYTSHNVNDP